MPRPMLYVEGPDDDHTIRHLMIRHGINYDNKSWPDSYPHIEQRGGKDALLESIEPTVMTATGRPMGFVIDADESLLNRWRAVSDRLARVGVKSDKLPPPGGFVGESETYQTKVGVWVMPDNARRGSLESFLLDCIAATDPIVSYAKRAAVYASKLKAPYKRAHREKAIVHTWLAWQDEPGHPFGQALRMKLFAHDSEVASRFADWFKTLYSI